MTRHYFLLVLTVLTLSACESDTGGAPGRGGAAAAPVMHKLTVAVVGAGTVTSAPDGIACGSGSSDCSEDYLEGSVIELTAEAPPGSRFVGWSGACSGARECRVTLDAARTVGAQFEPVPTRRLNVGTLGPGSVSGPGIACGAGSTDCGEDYSDGAVVELTPAPAAGAHFTSWGGACSGTGACHVTMRSDQTVSAMFEAIPNPRLTVSKAGLGSVVSDIPGIACGEDCSEDYAMNTVVKLSATAAQGYRFAGWMGACSNVSGDCTVTMSAARTVGALFEVLRYPLTVERLGGEGVIQSSPSGINCGGAGNDCGEAYDHGTPVTLSAAAADGFRFLRWEGACTGESCTVAMTQARQVSAVFEALPSYLLKVVSINGAGQVSAPGIACTNGAGDCEERYREGTQVSLTPAAGADHRFDRWSGACSGSAECSLVMSADREVGARFVRLPPTLAVGDVTVAEGAGKMSFTISLSRAVTDTVRVSFASSDGSASAGQDYFGRGGPLSFAPGETSKTVDLTINQDSIDEPTETLNLTLSAPENATLADAGGTGNITDDDLPPPTALGCPVSPAAAATAPRRVEVVVIPGSQVTQWTVPPASGVANPYPSGVGGEDAGQITEPARLNIRSAHNGRMVYPPLGAPAALMGKPAERIAAYKWDGAAFIEVPVQVDQKFPYFLANANSDFSFYSGTDEEITYQWDRERWTNDGVCFASYAAGMKDPVTGLDDDDEIAIMAQDLGGKAPQGARPSDPDLDPAETLQEVTVSDPLNPACPNYLYLGLKKAGKPPAYYGQEVYVKYTRDANADQWVDRSFWANDDPLKIGTGNTPYGSNLSGKVCPTGLPGSAQDSTDRFPRDGTTVQTDAYRWYASGRWMVRSIEIAKPGQALTPNRAPGQGIAYGLDLVDRWKGRAFQQSPDSNISAVGFEDEQVNWEANSILIGDLTGPVRAIREVWGADSGTNVTKTEYFARDFMIQRYRVRVHPIPSDGLYTNWDYNRGAMVPGPGENVPAGRYYTVLKPDGVLIDGLNDDQGQVDSTEPVNGQCATSDGEFVPPAPNGKCPTFTDAADPTLNLPIAFDNWEQVSAKGDNGTLVYSFELKGVTSAVNPLVVPYYRDDACLDDGTGDDPVQRFWPREPYADKRVRDAYDANAGYPLKYTDPVPFADCLQRQGAHGQHGIHYFFTGDSDNAMGPKPLTEIDGQQWQFTVPSFMPANVGESYINIVRAPLKTSVAPAP